MTEIIRVVQPTEASRLSEIGELTALAYLADGLVDGAHPYIPQLKNAQARAEKAILLAMADGERGEGSIVGTVTVVPPESPFIELAKGGEYELRMLAVNPIERGRGIGASLTKAGLRLAIERGATGVVLSTMESMHAAHRLYERMGFTRRPDLDWVVTDQPDGSVAPAPDDPNAVRLIGYSWDVSKPVD